MTASLRVIRGYRYDHLVVVDGLAYPVLVLRDQAFREIEAAGYPFWTGTCPPFFYTGSPYADALLGLAWQSAPESLA